MTRVLVTGATGFVGRALCRSLASSGYEVVGTTRSHDLRCDIPGVRLHTVSDIRSGAEWEPILDHVDEVVHLAARVHLMNDTSADPLAEFRAINTLGTEVLAKIAAAACVKRFVFVSTIKVLGERTSGRPFVHTDAASPSDPYSISKYEAEVTLNRIAAESRMEVVILRPALIYGPGVGGNVRRVLRLVDRRVPVPIASVRNARSMLALENLVDVILLCLETDDVAGQSFLVADDVAISTPELVRIVGKHMGKPARLFPVAVPLLRLAGKLLGRSDEIDRLRTSFLVDIEHTKRSLKWTPKIAPEEGLRTVVQSYLEWVRKGA